MRAALKLVATGEAPLGIVYRTDAEAEPAVQVVGVFPGESHPPIIYPVARVAASPNPDANDFPRLPEVARCRLRSSRRRASRFWLPNDRHWLALIT